MCYAAQKPLVAYSAPCVNPCTLGGLLATSATEFVAQTSTQELASTTCCVRRKCQRLKFVVICPTPWTFLPGAPTTGGCSYTQSYQVNSTPGRCQPPVTGGTPWCLKLNGSPVPVNVYDIPPVEVLEAYPNQKYRSIVFDFGPAKSGKAEGMLVAQGWGGCVQASLKFIYRWCGPYVCKDKTKPQFEVVANSGVNARFTVLDPMFLSSDPCTESIVVVQIQQWCCDKTRCRTGLGQGEDVLVQPPLWVKKPLTCMQRKLLPSCGPPCLSPDPCLADCECLPPLDAVTDYDMWRDCGDGICREPPRRRRRSRSRSRSPPPPPRE